MSENSAVNVDRLYAKITTRLIPVIFLCYVASYLDRVNVGFAKLQMESDLGLTEAAYGLGAGLFFVGYIIFEVPSNLVLHKVGAKLWIARIMITWAVISGALSLATNEAVFYLLRFLLGVAEAGFIPGILYYLTLWYPSARRGRIFAYFLAAIPVASIFGGPVSGWIMSALDGTTGLAGWQWVFIIEAVPSLVLGFVVLALLPNSVHHAKWLTPVERDTVEKAVAAERIVTDGGHTMRGVLTNSRVWLLSGVYFCIALGIYVISFWLPTIISNSGVEGTVQTGLLTAVPYLAAVIAMIAVNVHADRTGERRWHTALPCVVTALGLVIVGLGLENTVTAMIGLTLAAAGASTAQAAFWPLPSAFLVGTAAAGGIALVNSVGNISGLVSTSIVGLLTDLTGSSQSSLYGIAIVLLIGAGLLLRVPKGLVEPNVAQSAQKIGA